MRKIFIISTIAVLLSSCATTRWAELDDGPLEEPSEQEALFIRERMQDAMILEDFNDRDVHDGIAVLGRHNTERGVVEIPGDGTWVRVNPGYTFQRVIACYRIDSDTGHVFISTDLPEGHTDLFNDAYGDWAHNMDGTTPYTRVESSSFGQKRTSRWIVQEMRIEGNELVFLSGDRVFGRIPLEESTGFETINIRANVGGTGELDWLVLD
ncbi:MAG: hypothetical protein ACOCU4_04620 [Alkalispirochaeta sp.]